MQKLWMHKNSCESLVKKLAHLRLNEKNEDYKCNLERSFDDIDVIFVSV